MLIQHLYWAHVDTASVLAHVDTASVLKMTRMMKSFSLLTLCRITVFVFLMLYECELLRR
jgi:hypothetical protein